MKRKHTAARRILSGVLAAGIAAAAVPAAVAAATVEELPGAASAVGSAIRSASHSIGQALQDSVTQLGQQNLQQVSQTGDVLTAAGKAARDLVHTVRAAVSSGDWQYEELGDGTLKITAYFGSEQVINIPSEIDGYRVTEIGDRVFDYYGRPEILSVNIPEGITKIGFGAFSDCDGLTSVTLPSTMKEIGSEAFEGCSGLVTVVFPEGLEKIDSAAFSGCTKLTNAIIPSTVVQIGSTAFKGCTSLTSFTFPQGTKMIESNALEGCTSLRNVVIPDGVISIGDSAFNECASLMKISIPNSVISLGSNAFAGCSALTEITLSNAMTSIGSSAFRGCSALDEVAIPYGVTSIEGYAFSQCTRLKNVTIPSSVAYIGDLAFSECESLKYIDIPQSVSSMGVSVFSKCYALESIVFPDTISVIQDHIFEDCRSLKFFEISSNVTTIGQSAFDGCSSLKEITIPDSVTQIGICAFRGCEVLESVELSNSLNTIPGGIFAECINLTHAEIPDGVTVIGFTGYPHNAGAFRGCENLRYITVPNSIMSISYAAFNGCPQLTDIYYAGSEEDWKLVDGSNYFEDVTIHYNSNGPTLIDGFNMVTYRADDLYDPDSVAHKALENVLEIRGVCEDLLPHVNSGVMFAWDALSTMIDTIGNPLAPVDMYVEKSDMYAAGLMKILNASMEMNILEGFQNMVTWKANLMGVLDNVFQSKYHMTADQLNHGFKDLGKAEQNQIKADVQSAFNTKSGISEASKIMSFFQLGLDIFDSIESYLEYLYSGYVLMNMTDSAKLAVNEMVHSASDGNLFLKKALAECVEIIDSGTFEFLNKAATRLSASAGYDVSKFFIGQLWGELQSSMMALHPGVGIIYASAIGSRLLTDALFNTDEQVTRYGEMLMSADLQDLAIKTYESLSAKYQSDPTEKNAGALLSSVDFMFAAFNVDYESAYYFFDVADKSFVNNVMEFFTGCNDVRDIKNQIRNIQDGCGNLHHSVLTGWIGELEKDYPGSGLAEHYEYLIEEIMDKVEKQYTIACPVDVYIYDKKTSELVASVINNTPWCTDIEVSIGVVGDEKIINFYDDADYRIELVGNDSGTMDVTVQEFDDSEQDIRTVTYQAIPLTDGKCYETAVDNSTMQQAAYKIVDKDTNQEVEHAYDTLESGDKKYKLTVECGVAAVNGVACYTAEVTPGQLISLSAAVPDGYTFENWSANGGTIKDANSANTSFYMPATDVVVTAHLSDGAELPASITLSEKELHLDVGQQTELTATATPTGTIQWSSSNPDVLSVDSNGKVTAKATGVAEVIAYVEETGAIASCAVMVTDSSIAPLPGDVNGDGKVTATDARMVLQAVAGTIVLTEEQKAAADCDGDGKVSSKDAHIILQHTSAK